MFEKEAEEYIRKNRHDVINWDGAEPEERFYNEIKFKQAYLAGAEFGYNKYDERLIKANEIIKGLMRFCRCFAQHHTEDIRYKEAEQFLRELEE